MKELSMKELGESWKPVFIFKEAFSKTLAYPNWDYVLALTQKQSSPKSLK